MRKRRRKAIKQRARSGEREPLHEGGNSCMHETRFAGAVEEPFVGSDHLVRRSGPRVFSNDEFTSTRAHFAAFSI